MALKALLEPRKIQPKMTTSATVSSSALSGSPNEGCTLAKTLENGRPPSLRTPLASIYVGASRRKMQTYLAKAYVIRLLVVMIVIVAKRRQMRGNLFLIDCLGRDVPKMRRLNLQQQADRPSHTFRSIEENSQ